MTEAVKKCNELHDLAMSLADQAYDAEKQGDTGKAKAHFAAAFEAEKKSAMILSDEYEIEPSRSVLFRSAAWLAIKAEKYREAEKMAAFGLSGSPPPPVDKELREVFKHILEYFTTEVAA